MQYKFSVWQVHNERGLIVGVYSTKEAAESVLIELQSQKDLDHGVFCGIKEIKVEGTN